MMAPAALRQHLRFRAGTRGSAPVPGCAAPAKLK